MLGALTRQLRPRLSRGLTQVLSEPMAWNQSPVVVTTLPNGVKVATKETFADTSSVGIFVNAGSRDESRETAGAAHLVEQLAFTGTKKRPKAQLETEVESMGALMNMTSGREQTSYTISVCNKDVKQGVDILADLVTSPPLGNLAKEKESILANLDEVEKPTRSVLDDRLHMCAWRDYPLGFSSLGPFDGIHTLTEAHVKSYMDANYTADKMVLAAAGPMKHEELVALASSALGGVKAGTPAPGSSKPYFCGAELIYRNDEMGPTAYICVGWEAVPWKSPDAVTFMVMQAIMGSYTKGEGLVPGTISGNRIVNAVANKMQVGCADKFEAFNLCYKDTGMFGFYIECDEVAVEHAVGELMFGANLLSFSVTDEEVERGKRELKCALFSQSDSPSALVDEMGKQVLAYGRGVSPAEMLLRIDAVDAEEVKRVAWKYLNDNEVAVTALGPLHGMPQYYDLRRATVMHRY
mmetsp:Transcript_138869/g.432023  ORF Transcript_138869/g.432023 Transcript_138869/m.432023 type:complete len:466 (-) Transcript_138869:78-1475(-)